MIRYSYLDSYSKGLENNNQVLKLSYHAQPQATLCIFCKLETQDGLKKIVVQGPLQEIKTESLKLILSSEKARPFHS